jgi:hypothetical protein
MKHHIIIILLLTFFTFLTLNACFRKKTSYTQSVFTDTTKPRNIQSITTLRTINKGVIHPRIDTAYLLDSISTYKFSYQDDWMKLNGEIGKTATIGYLFKDSIVLTTYKKHFQTYVSGYSFNPNVQLSGITTIKVRQPRFSIGPSLNYSWNGTKFSPSIGISLQYSLIKF